MTSSAPGRVAQTLGFRLAFWYAAIFTVSVLLIAVIAYALLARSLTQRDHDLIRVKLADYAARFESAGVAGVEPRGRRRAGVGQRGPGVRAPGRAPTPRSC